MTAIVFGIGSLAALAALDWYVWGRMLVPTMRRPRTVQPLTAGELTEQFLDRMVMVNQEVLPQSVLATAQVEPVVADTSSDGHGFRKVA
jgi:hypothetical protein